MTVVWDTVPTTVTVTGQTGTVVYSQGTTTIATGTIGSPTGAAGGDLTGTYPDPTVHKVHGVNMQSGTPADGDLWQYQASNTRWRHRNWTQCATDGGVTAAGLALLDDADAAAQRTTLGLGTTDTPVFTAVEFSPNGERIVNTTNGRVDIMPAPTSSSAFGFYIDTTSYGFGVRLGIIRSSDGVLNPVSRAILVDSALLMGDGIDIGVGSSQWYTISAQGSTQKAMTLGVLTGDQNSGSSGALVVVQNNQRGLTNRIPTTDHAHPTLYVYAGGAANAADYVRINHDTTDGTIEAGRGVMIVTGASGVRINGSFGFGTAPTAVQTGYTTFTNLTTDRTCNANATTVDELADILGTLIEDLKAKGIISA